MNPRLLTNAAAGLLLAMSLAMIGVMIAMRFFDWLIAVACAGGIVISCWSYWKSRRS